MFDRWVSPLPDSFPMRRFKAHHTEINRLYWSLVPAAGFADYLARHAQIGATPTTLFHASGPNVHRIASSLAVWRRNFSEFENWTRLSALVSLLSYFEAYLTTVTTLALRSDPLLRFKQPRTVDGTLWLKRSVVDDVSSLITPIVKGAWPDRRKAFEELFGSAPVALTTYINDLDEMRRLRNGVAHSFGRESAFFEDPMVHAGEPVRLSERRLQKWLAIVEAVATSVDNQLHPVHLGNFELVWRYHRWLKEARHKEDRRYEPSAAFCRKINREFGLGAKRTYADELIAYYDAVGP